MASYCVLNTMFFLFCACVLLCTRRIINEMKLIYNSKQMSISHRLAVIAT